MHTFDLNPYLGRSMDDIARDLLRFENLLIENLAIPAGMLRPRFDPYFGRIVMKWESDGDRAWMSSIGIKWEL